MKKLITLLLLILIGLHTKAEDTGLEYEYFGVSASIDANNTWHVTESQYVNFTTPHHGVYRFLPTSFYARLNRADDGQPQDTPSKEYLVDVDFVEGEGAEVCTYEEDDNLVIRFGSENSTLTGQHEYYYSYTYAYPTDRIKARDFIFHTLKPANMKEAVAAFGFELTFAKPLPDDIAQRLKFYTGQLGDGRVLTDVEELIVTPNRIEGYIYNLEPGEAVTVYAELPEGYWEGLEEVSPIPSFIFAYAALALAILLIIIELTIRRPKSLRTIEFYPPDGVTPSEVGKIIDDSTDNIDLTALVPWLAERGYLNIKELKEDGKKKTDIELIRTNKMLPKDAPAYQHSILKMLFPKGNTNQLMSQLGKHPEKVDAAKKALDNHFTGERKLREINAWHVIVALLLVLCSTMALGLNSSVCSWDWGNWIYVFATWPCHFVFALFLRNAYSAKDAFRSRGKLVTVFVLRALVFVFNSLLMMILFEKSDDNFLPNELLIAIMLLCYLVTELSGRLERDTEYRAQMKGRLLGFKDFIATAEKDKLEMLNHEDPSYFYKVLPYAMVFELTNKWVKQFKDIEIKEVDWYTTPLLYDSTSGYIHGLTSHVNDTISEAIQNSSVSASSSSGGGGGFSGGGGGGGGAGGW